jgi:dGTPase
MICSCSTHAGLEAQIAAISDDIAYNNHDIEDGLRAGFFVLDDLCELPLLGDIIGHVRTAYPALSERRQTHEVVRRMINQMVGDVIAQTRQIIAAKWP